MGLVIGAQFGYLGQLTVSVAVGEEYQTGNMILYWQEFLEEQCDIRLARVSEKQAKSISGQAGLSICKAEYM